MSSSSLSQVYKKIDLGLYEKVQFSFPLIIFPDGGVGLVVFISQLHEENHHHRNPHIYQILKKNVL